VYSVPYGPEDTKAGRGYRFLIYLPDKFASDDNSLFVLVVFQKKTKTFMKKTLLLFLAVWLIITNAKAQFPPTTVDDAVQGTGENQFNYVGGGWAHGSNTSDPYNNNTVSYSSQSGNYVTLTFTGVKIVVFSAKASHHGIAAFSIDNGPETNVDMYAATRESYVKIYSSPSLNQAVHTLKIRVTGTKNSAATNTYAILDYVMIYNAPTYTNTVTGTQALASNLSGSHITANGYRALFSNTFGIHNTATGYLSMYSNDGGSDNSAYGSLSLYTNHGSQNAAFGVSSLYSNFDGGRNTAMGYLSMFNSAGGFDNTAVGHRALVYNINGHYNTAVGSGAMATSDVVAVSNSTAIGYASTVTGSNQVRLGNSDVTSIGGQVSWSTLSDGRFKKDIKEDVSGLDFISKLRPVSYTVDKVAVDKFLRIPDSLKNNTAVGRQKVTRQTGFIAQEVEEVIKKTGYVFHGVETPQSESDHYSIRYAEFVVPLVKAVQELNTLLKEQSVQHAAEIAELKEQLKSSDGLGKGLSETETLLYQNNPNPFSSDTEIKMSLPESTVNATVIVYNMEGRQLKELSVKGRGEASVKIAASDLHAGMYLYALIVDGKVVDTKRMILTK
jgi:trimeric autotransporter adhesin